MGPGQTLTQGVQGVWPGAGKQQVGARLRQLLRQSLTQAPTGARQQNTGSFQLHSASSCTGKARKISPYSLKNTLAA